MPNTKKMSQSSPVPWKWIGLGLAGLLIVVGIIIAIVMTSNSDNNNTSGGGTDSDDNTTTSLAACRAEGGEPGKLINANHANLTDPVERDSDGHTMHNGAPVLTPMQCAAKCEATNDCWGYTFGFQGEGVASAYCDMKSAYDLSTWATATNNSSTPHLHYSGEKCKAPKYTSTLSNNYYTLAGGRASNPTLLTTHSNDVFWGFGGTRVERNSRSDATGMCQTKCNEDARCNAFSLSMERNDPTTTSNFALTWECRLFRESEIHFAMEASSTNTYDPNSCQVSVQVDASQEPGEALSDDLNDCNVVGWRLYEEET
jgi:hypothetical protein